MTFAELRNFWNTSIKRIAGGPTDRTRGANVLTGLLDMTTKLETATTGLDAVASTLDTVADSVAALQNSNYEVSATSGAFQVAATLRAALALQSSANSVVRMRQSYELLTDTAFSVDGGTLDLGAGTVATGAVITLRPGSRVFGGIIYKNGGNGTLAISATGGGGGGAFGEVLIASCRSNHNISVAASATGILDKYSVISGGPYGTPVFTVAGKLIIHSNCDLGGVVPVVTGAGVIENHIVSGGGTPTPTQLAAPASPQATASGSTSMSITASSVANATGYKLYFNNPAIDSAYTQIGGTLSTPSYNQTGLTASTAYNYKWLSVGNGSTYTDSALSAVFSGTTSSAGGTTALITPTSYLSNTGTLSAPSSHSYVPASVTNATSVDVEMETNLVVTGDAGTDPNNDGNVSPRGAAIVVAGVATYAEPTSNGSSVTVTVPLSITSATRVDGINSYVQHYGGVGTYYRTRIKKLTFHGTGVTATPLVVAAKPLVVTLSWDSTAIGVQDPSPATSNILARMAASLDFTPFWPAAGGESLHHSFDTPEKRAAHFTACAEAGGAADRKVHILVGGTNDTLDKPGIGAYATGATCGADMAAYYTEALAAYPNDIWVFLTPFGYAPSLESTVNSLGETPVQFRVALRNAVAAVPGVTVLNGPDVVPYSSANSYDGVHLKPAGNAVAAAFLLPYVQPAAIPANGELLFPNNSGTLVYNSTTKALTTTATGGAALADYKETGVANVKILQGTLGGISHRYDATTQNGAIGLAGSKVQRDLPNCEVMCFFGGGAFYIWDIATDFSSDGTNNHIGPPKASGLADGTMGRVRHLSDAQCASAGVVTGTCYAETSTDSTDGVNGTWTWRYTYAKRMDGPTYPVAALFSDATTKVSTPRYFGGVAA